MEEFKTADDFKRFEDLNIQDNFLFQRIMLKKGLCIEFVRRATSYDVKDVTYPEEEKVIEAGILSKGVRLDVYVIDETGKVYDMEMQLRMGEKGDLPRRTRYYQAMIDTDLLTKGNAYQDLNMTVIVFICTFDYFDKGLPVYTFSKTCKEDKSVELGDDTVIIFLNTQYTVDNSNPKLKALLDYIDKQEISDDFTKCLDEEAKFIKDSEKVRVQYMTYIAEIQDQRRQAHAEGREEERITNIKSIMQKLGMSAKKAMDVLNIAPSEQEKYLPQLQN